MIDFMVWLQNFRTPFLNTVVELITISAEETVLIVIMCIVFWCVSREHGYKMILSIVLASASNAALKLLFKTPRPWLRDSRIVPIRQHTALSYSMPSGHTQVGASMWYSICRSSKNKPLVVIGYIMMVLIAASRVYLSVHMPQDVIVSLILVVLGVLLSHYLVDIAIKKDSVVPFAILAVVAFVGLFFVKNDNYFKMTGLLISLPFAFYLENKYIKFSTKTVWWKQILKVVIGFIVVLLFKEGLKFILPDTLAFGALRYFFVGISAVYLVPLVFVSLKLSEKTA